VSEAIRAGWNAPRVITDEEPDIPEDSSDDDSPDGAILDYRVSGYPEGAIILVVLDGGDLTQASVAVTGLAQHLTTWSPGLLEYSPSEVRISKIDKPYDDENWLPPVEEEDEEDSEHPRWHLAELLDEELQDLAAEYLLACAVRSLWDPAESRHRAWDIAAGAVEDPLGGAACRHRRRDRPDAGRGGRGRGQPAGRVLRGARGPRAVGRRPQGLREGGECPDSATGRRIPPP
jgi:hypothetical protein